MVTELNVVSSGVLAVLKLLNVVLVVLDTVLEVLETALVVEAAATVVVDTCVT